MLLQGKCRSSLFVLYLLHLCASVPIGYPPGGQLDSTDHISKSDLPESTSGRLWNGQSLLVLDKRQGFSGRLPGASPNGAVSKPSPAASPSPSPSASPTPSSSPSSSPSSTASSSPSPKPEAKSDSKSEVKLPEIAPVKPVDSSSPVVPKPPLVDPQSTTKSISADEPKKGPSDPTKPAIGNGPSNEAHTDHTAFAGQTSSTQQPVSSPKDSRPIFSVVLPLTPKVPSESTPIKSTEQGISKSIDTSPVTLGGTTPPKGSPLNKVPNGSIGLPKPGTPPTADSSSEIPEVDCDENGNPIGLAQLPLSAPAIPVAPVPNGNPIGVAPTSPSFPLNPAASVLNENPIGLSQKSPPGPLIEDEPVLNENPIGLSQKTPSSPLIAAAPVLNEKPIGVAPGVPLIPAEPVFASSDEDCEEEPIKSQPAVPLPATSSGPQASEIGLPPTSEEDCEEESISTSNLPLLTPPGSPSVPVPGAPFSAPVEAPVSTLPLPVSAPAPAPGAAADSPSPLGIPLQLPVSAEDDEDCEEEAVASAPPSGTPILPSSAASLPLAGSNPLPELPPKGMGASPYSEDSTTPFVAAPPTDAPPSSPPTSVKPPSSGPAVAAPKPIPQVASPSPCNACEKNPSMLSNLLDMSDKMLGIVDKLMNIFSKFSGGSQQSLKPEGSNTAPVEAVDPVKDVSSSPASTPKSTYSSSASNSKPASSTKYESKSPKV